MVTLLITSFFIIGLIVVALYFWQKPARADRVELLPPTPDLRGLFAPDDSEQRKLVEKQAPAGLRRAEILALAESGSKSALDEAHRANDDSLYDEVLGRLTLAVEGPQLLSLVSYISRNNLRVTSSLAEKFIQSWKTAPTRNSMAEMLHVAALSNDARTYTAAIEASMQFWRNGNLSHVSANELRSLIEGEFWVISSQERSTGAGFLLKQTLADVRRELEVAARTEATLPTPSN